MVFVFHFLPPMKIVLALLLVFYLLPQHGLGQKQDRPALAENKEQQTAAPVPLPQKAADTCPNQQCGYRESPPWWKTPEGWLAILGIPSLGVLVWQACETHAAAAATSRSAAAALRSIRLQEAGMQQWVDIDALDVHSPQIPMSAGGAKLTISFVVKNPTRLPLTLTAALLVAEPVWDKKAQQCSSVGMRHALPPDNARQFSIELPIYGRQYLDQYRLKQLSIVVSADIEFEDAFSRHRKQGFVFTGKCGPINWHNLTQAGASHAVEK
jgi:hypothetical protein